MPGTYTLVVELPVERTVAVGALGERSLAPGWYAYTGSATGPGGFARVERHERVASGENDARHWHVDYLLGAPESDLRADVRTAVDAECAIARAVADAPEVSTPVDGFGASDCGCLAHLAYAESEPRLWAAVEAAHADVGERAGGATENR